MRKLILFTALLSAALNCACAQTTQILASNIIGADTHKLTAGTITFRATDMQGSPFFGHQVGLMIPRAVVCLIANGAITTAQSGGACTLVDTAATSPTHFCYATTIYDSISMGKVPAIPCLQPTGSTWSLDSYVPVSPTELVAPGLIGPQGERGPAGATIDVGSTTTGAPGTPASVVNSGSSSAVILNFAIPQGATGAPGPQGAKGDPGPQGVPGTGCTGSGCAGASFPDITDDNTAVILSKPMRVSGAGQGVQVYAGGVPSSTPPPDLPTHYAGWGGPTSGTQDYILDMPPAAPTQLSALVCGVPSTVGTLNHSPCQWMALAGSDASIPTAGTWAGQSGTIGCIDGSGGLTTVGCSTVPTATPTFTPASPYTGLAGTLTIADGTSGAIIQYCTTTSGTSCIPGTQYTAPIAVASSEYVCAIGAATGYLASLPVCWQGTISSVVSTPTFSPASPYSGSSSTTLTIADATSGATILYCTDTTNACTPATTYASPLTISSSGYVRSQAVLSGYTSSSVASWKATIQVFAGGNPVLIQHAAMTSNTATTSSAASYATGLTPTAGHLMVLAILLADGGGTTLNSVTDNLGNTWVIDGMSKNPGSTSSAAIAHSYLTTGGAALTVTAAFNHDLTHVAMETSEWSGSSSADVANGSTGTGTVATTSLTTTASVDLIIGVVMDYAAQVSTPSTGMTQLDVVGGYGPVEYQITTSAGTYTPGAILNNAAGWAAEGASFR